MKTAWAKQMGTPGKMIRWCGDQWRCGARTLSCCILKLELGGIIETAMSLNLIGRAGIEGQRTHCAVLG